MTEELFREDAHLQRCDARISAITEAGIELDRTVFYPHGGGQAGDAGLLRLADGRSVAIADTRKGTQAGQIVHVPAPDADLSGLTVGMAVVAEIDWARRDRKSVV